MGPYELLERIGAGGGGEVWRARHTHLHKDVAIKLIAADLAHDPEWRARFEREARAAVRARAGGVPPHPERGAAAAGRAPSHHARVPGGAGLGLPREGSRPPVP